jgi:hypothetical protein
MREALELFREADSPMGIAQVLQALTFMASWEGRHTDAVRLAGAAEALPERLGGRAPWTSWAASSATPRAPPAPTSPRGGRPGLR